jgi:hypothetical protein
MSSGLPSGQGFIPQYAAVSKAVKYRNAGIAVVLVGFAGGVYAWTYQKMRTVSASRAWKCGALRRAARAFQYSTCVHLLAILSLTLPPTRTR